VTLRSNTPGELFRKGQQFVDQPDGREARPTTPFPRQGGLATVAAGGAT
jgi:hypothetical protein